MGAINPRLAARARRQHGVLTGAQVAEHGVTIHQLRSAVDRGELERPHPGVYRIAGAPRTWHQSLLVGVFAAGPDALASHRSAAALWDLDGSWFGRPELVTARHLRSRFGPVRVHESKDLRFAEPTTQEAIPCTGLARTLLDLGAVLPPDRVQQAIDDAIRRNLCSWDDLLHTMVVHSRRGRNGVGVLRGILEESYGKDVPGSRFNRLVHRLLVDSGACDPVVEHRVHNAAGVEIARVDLAIPELRIAIELDSRRHHLSVEAFEKDRQRQNRLEVEGWLVLRYTWRFYVDRPWALVAEVRAAIARRAQPSR